LRREGGSSRAYEERRVRVRVKDRRGEGREVDGG
jgi:hypothetical protein